MYNEQTQKIEADSLYSCVFALQTSHKFIIKTRYKCFKIFQKENHEDIINRESKAYMYGYIGMLGNRRMQGCRSV